MSKYEHKFKHIPWRHCHVSGVISYDLEVDSAGGFGKPINLCIEDWELTPDQPMSLEEHLLSELEDILPHMEHGACILTGETGENADDCTTHRHEDNK
jgi:hypothetical protein